MLVLTLHCVSGDFNRLEKKRASINVVILDCCREFMFAPSPTRGGERKRLNSGGTCFNRLKRLNSPGTCVYGSITAFPCGPNDTVSDNGRRPLIQPKYRNANNTTFILRIHSSQWHMLLQPAGISNIYFNHTNPSRLLHKLSGAPSNGLRTRNKRNVFTRFQKSFRTITAKTATG